MIVVDRAQIYLEGSNLQSEFQVGVGGIVAIRLIDNTVRYAVGGLNYTPNYISCIQNTVNVIVEFAYAFTEDDRFFDFSTLPYAQTNVQMALTNMRGELIALTTGAYNLGSSVGYNKIGDAALRIVRFGVNSIVYMPKL